MQTSPMTSTRRLVFSGVERIPEHIPVFIFVSCRVDSLMFAKSSVSAKTGTSLYHRTMSETLWSFLGADVSDN